MPSSTMRSLKPMAHHLSTENSRNYAGAIAALNTLQSNHATVSKIRRHGREDQDRAIPEMIEFTSRAGISVKDLEHLNSIHVAGTKGKGSTCAFVSSILSTHLRSEKIGLYTSPHLRFVRERIQVNSTPISENEFAKSFFEVWDKLSSSGDGGKPMYFRFLTILAFHEFLKQGMHTSIIECGIGGEYDSTNIMNSPSITAITALGIDHEALLGRTLPDIAWHKAGIFKSGSIALTTTQPAPAMAVLENRAQSKGVELFVVGRHPQIESGEVQLSLSADYQKSNASLAAAIASAHLRRMGDRTVPDLLGEPEASLPTTFVKGLRNARWAGRSDIRRDGRKNLTWYLDGAHTIESIDLAAKWFSGELQKNKKEGRRVLIFNQQSRDAKLLLKTLYQSLAKELGDSPFDEAIFCTNVTTRSAGYKPDLLSLNNNLEEIQDLSVQKGLADLWEEMSSNGSRRVTSSVEEAVDLARDITHGAINKDEGTVFVVGSLHLVGGVLDILEE